MECLGKLTKLWKLSEIRWIIAGALILINKYIGDILRVGMGVRCSVWNYREPKSVVGSGQQFLFHDLRIAEVFLSANITRFTEFSFMGLDV